MKAEAPRFYFIGVDPAAARGSKSNDGTLAVLQVSPRPGIAGPTGNVRDWRAEYVWAYRLRAAAGAEEPAERGDGGLGNPKSEMTPTLHTLPAIARPRATAGATLHQI